MENDKKIFLPLLLYDSDCTMCTRFKEALERLPESEKICMLPIIEKEVYERFPQLDVKECQETVHLIDENEKVHSGGEVVTYLAHFYPGINKFAWLLDTNVGKKAVDFFYDTVNKYRKSMLNSCQGCKKR